MAAARAVVPLTEVRADIAHCMQQPDVKRYSQLNFDNWGRAAQAACVLCVLADSCEILSEADECPSPTACVLLATAASVRLLGCTADEILSKAGSGGLLA